MRASSLVVAAAQPRCHARDVATNAAEHAAVVRTAHARIVVFPELSLTGYEVDAPSVAVDDQALAPIVEACAETNSIALVGAPIVEQGLAHIAMVAVDGAGAAVAYRKTWLSADEAPYFHAGDGPTMITVDGWRLGLGICKDTGAAQHIAGVAALDVHAYLAGLVHHPEELPEQEARAYVIARTCRAYVLFASFAGETGHGYGETAGSSAIYAPDGVAVARTGSQVGGVARARLV